MPETHCLSEFRAFLHKIKDGSKTVYFGRGDRTINFYVTPKNGLNKGFLGVSFLRFEHLGLKCVTHLNIHKCL